MPPPFVREPQFQPLHEVLAKVFASEPKICCAYFNDNGSHCQYNPKFTKIEDAMYWVTFISQSLYSIRNQHSPLPGYMSQLCHYCLCSDHRFGGYANSKWEKDLKNEVMQEKFISLLKTNKKWPPPDRVLEFNRFKSDLPLANDDQSDLETIKRVDKVLAKDVNGIDKDYLYVLRSPWAVGKLKIGVSAQDPRGDRFDEHLRCYPGSKMLNQYGIPKRAYRVEQILLAQFQGNRFKLRDQCWSCGERHEEWLNIDEETLFEWIHKWVDFFIRGPVFPLYDKKGHFNAKARECSPLRDSPERSMKIPPITKGPLFPLHSSTPRNESPSPISKSVGNKETSWGVPEDPDFTPTKSNGRFSREPTPLNDSPDPFSEIGSDRYHEKVNGNSLGIPESTPTKNSRRSSLRSSTPLNDSPAPSKVTGDVKKKSKNLLKLPDSTPTKNHRRSLSPSPSPSPTPLDERPILSRKTRGDIQKSVDSALDTPLISGVDSLTINSSQRRTSARLKTPVK